MSPAVNITFLDTWSAIDMRDRVVVRYISDQKSWSGIVKILDAIYKYVINQSCWAVAPFTNMV